jgi:uncharacterized membrane protein
LRADRVSELAVRDRLGAGERAERRIRALATPSHVVYCTAAAWGLAFAGLAALRHVAFMSTRYDLGDMVQAVWATAHGHFLQVTTTSGAQIPRLGGHFDPILALFAPLWWVWPSPLLLVVAQSVAIGLGALPVFWLARKHLASQTVAAWLAVAYLLYLPIQLLTVDDFHPVALGVPLLLFALWYLDEDELAPFAVCAVLASLTGEEFPALVAWLGIWYAVRRRHVRAGALIAVVGLAASALAFYVVIPGFSAGGTGLFASRYSELGGSPQGIVSAVVHRPYDVAATMFTGQHLVYLLLLVVPWAGLWALEPVLALGAAPVLLLNLLSGNRFQTSLGFHYTAPIVPFLIGASVLGAAKLRPSIARQAGLAVLALMTLMLVGSPFRFTPGWIRDYRSAHRAAESAALRVIPDGVPITASNRLGAHLSDRRRFLAFPFLEDAQWVAVEKDDGFLGGAYAPRRYRTYLARLRHDPHWKVVFQRDGVLVFRRVKPGGPARLDRRA